MAPLVPDPVRQDLEALSAKFVALRVAPDGFAVIDLGNEQTWLQIAGRTALLLKVGDEVRIDRGAVNSFQLRVPSGRSAKVRRLR
jgi:hypothetical protein